MRRLWIALVVLLLVGCDGGGMVIVTPTPAEDGSEAALNDNPELRLGMCVEFSFPTDGGPQWLSQCVPAGYTLHQYIGTIDGDTDPENGALPIDVDYTGDEYSMLVAGRAGEIGFEMLVVSLDAGCYVAKMTGLLHVWGEPLDYSIQGFVDDADGGRTELIPVELPANGRYEVIFPFRVDHTMDVNVTVYFRFAFGSATGDSYATIDTLELLAVSAGHCVEAPLIE